MPQEEQVACAEEVLIVTTPITGIGNSLRFNYRIDITQAQMELISDPRRASKAAGASPAIQGGRHRLLSRCSRTASKSTTSAGWAGTA